VGGLSPVSSQFLISSGHAFGVVIRVRDFVRKLDGLGLSRRELESEVQRGSAVKAVFSLERFLPDNKHGSGIGDCIDGGGVVLKRIRA